jgi:hypothetical protein
MKLLFLGAAVLLITMSVVVMVSLWEMFDSEEGIDD